MSDFPESPNIPRVGPRRPFGEPSVRAAVVAGQTETIRHMNYEVLHPRRWILTNAGISLMLGLALFIMVLYVNPPFIHRPAQSDIERRLPSYWRAAVFSAVPTVLVLVAGIFSTRKVKEYQVRDMERVLL